MSNELLVIEDIKLVPFFTKGEAVDETLAKIDEADRVETERLEQVKLEQQRKSDEAHYKTVMGETKQSIMSLGVDSETATKITLALKNGDIANVGKIKF